MGVTVRSRALSSEPSRLPSRRRAGEFQAATRDFIEQEMIGRAEWENGPQVFQIRLKRLLQIEHQRPGGDQSRLVIRLETETGQRDDAELLAKGGPGRDRVKGPIRSRGDRSRRDRAK